MLLVGAFGLWLRLTHTGPTPLDVWWAHLVKVPLDSVPYWVAVTLAEVGGGNGAMMCTALAAAICQTGRVDATVAVLPSASI